jgi:hypothetical protein
MDGERGYGDRASGGKEVWRRGWLTAAAELEVCERFEGLRRFEGLFTSRVDERFLLGICAGDGYGGDMAEGEEA